MSVPPQPKIYHICHVDRLSSIVQDGHLWCDAEVARRTSPGTTIGMNAIKQRRMRELTLSNHPDLYVGDCVPFYFCPRSVMLYLIYRANHPELSYLGGQESIVHLEADLLATITWAATQRRRWAFTLSNAGTRTSRIASALHSSERLIGTPYRRKIGATSERASRRNFC